MILVPRYLIFKLYMNSWIESIINWISVLKLFLILSSFRLSSNSCTNFESFNTHWSAALALPQSHYNFEDFTPQIVSSISLLDSLVSNLSSARSLIKIIDQMRPGLWAQDIFFYPNQVTVLALQVFRDNSLSYSLAWFSKCIHFHQKNK